ncbi:protein SINE1-like [Phragmites australis]|uniref:protein SINE1-like n=1 Tax=Phragmites australis TaxID=29695 RepID=UPI002D78F8BF|nr:protein SINE1-like [Phragmites australis]
MATSLGVGEYAELKDFVMDPINNKATFRGLKLYVKDLDSNTLPPFLSRVCAPGKPSSYSVEEILCIFETAAEVHGHNIVPHIGQIVSMVISIMASVPRSLHCVCCSKVVCTLSRYAIDPLGREEEKSGIIDSLCRPLSDCLMSTNENISSCSALCITALVQSNNWEFASNELVNDVCLKVSGALEEAHCQTVVHLSLVVALSKHNPLTLEPYGRSLIRSGLHILDDSTKASNSQMIMSSIQMIHSIMKSLNVRSISSEISSIIHALEQCQDDFIPDICTAAFQATETAKLLGMQEECGNHKKFSPLANSSGRHSRKGSNSPVDDVDFRDSGSSGSPCDLQYVRSFTGFDSQPSVGQCVGILGSARARRRLWSNGSDSSHGMSNDEFSHTAAPDSHDALGFRGQSNSVDLVKSGRRCSGVLTRIGDPCPTCLATNQFSQISRRQSLSGDIRMQSTPRKQLHSFTSCRDSERDGRQLPESPAFRQTQCCLGHCTNHLLFQKNGEFEERKGYCNSIQQGNQWLVQNTDLLTEDLKFPTNSGHSDSARTPCEEHQAEHEKMTGRNKRKANCSGSPFFAFVCVVVMIAFLLAWWKQAPNERYIVPT